VPRCQAYAKKIAKSDQAEHQAMDNILISITLD